MTKLVNTNIVLDAITPTALPFDIELGYFTDASNLDESIGNDFETIFGKDTFNADYCYISVELHALTNGSGYAIEDQLQGIIAISSTQNPLLIQHVNTKGLTGAAVQLPAGDFHDKKAYKTNFGIGDTSAYGRYRVIAYLNRSNTKQVEIFRTLCVVPSATPPLEGQIVKSKK